MVKIDTVELDAAITEKHMAKVEITKHPIEEGANPTDHARLLPYAISVDGLLTNTPLGAELRAARGVTSDRTTSTGAFGAAGPAQRSMAALEKIRTDRRAVTVVSDFRTYSNMLITSIDVPVDARTGEAIRFSISMEEIRFVKSEVARINVLNKPKKKPTTKVDQTKKPGTEAPPQNASIIKGKLNGWGVTKFGSGVR